MRSPAAPPVLQPSPATPGTEQPYQDRVIERLGFAPDAPDADDHLDAEGLARYLRIETRVSRDASGGAGRYTLGSLNAFGFVEKPNYGVISIDVDTQRESGARDHGMPSFVIGPSKPQAGTLTIRQRGLPLGNGRNLDSELGAIVAPMPFLARTLSRINLTSPRLQGAATTWLDEPRNVSAAASLGQPLQHEGLFASGVQRLPGTVLQLGAQWDAPPDPEALRQALDQRRLPRAWSAAVMLGEGRGLAPFGVYGSAWADSVPPSLGTRFNARSAWMAAGGDTKNLQWQAQALSTRLSGASLQADDAQTTSGIWADLNWSRGAFAHGVGGYALQRGLSWLGLPLASDVSGGYYRLSWQTRQWFANGGADVLRSLSSGRTGYYVVGGLRRRLSSRLQWGGNVALRNFNGRAHNIASDLQWRHSMGQTDLRAELSRDDAGGAAQRLTLHHDWDVEPGFALSTSVGGGRSRMAGQGTLPSWTAAISLDAPLHLRSVFRAAINVEQTGDLRRHNANLGLNWPLSLFWSLDLGANLQRGVTRSPRSVDPLVQPVLSNASGSEARSYFVALRYETRAGTGTAPLGGRPQDGGGAIEGRVFFDTNRNGSLDAGERGVPDAVVQLDGRYTTKSDAQGRYTFAWVAKGRHEITLLNETLPLPWAAPDDGRAVVEVALREVLSRDIAVTQ